MVHEWGRYVPVAERRQKAEREMAKRKKAGQPVSPVTVQGRTIARTFWGKAWCDNLERYSDFANRLPRGRTYVRNGSVVDLRIAPGEVRAVVSGSKLYTVKIQVTPVPGPQWQGLCADCAGAVDSLVELLQGTLSAGVMERICRRDTGLFPSPREIRLTCSCPDWATMCKHVAAVLYGVGARLDHEPNLLFLLRQVDETALLSQAGAGLALTGLAPDADRVLEGDDLASLFGVDLAPAADPAAAVPAAARAKRGRARKAPVAAPVPKTAPPVSKAPAPKTKAPVSKTKAPVSKPAPGPPVDAPVTLEKGTPVRMLAGVYAGWDGRITWCRAIGPKVTYAFALAGADGRKATTQAAASSYGTKWERA